MKLKTFALCLALAIGAFFLSPLTASAQMTNPPTGTVGGNPSTAYTYSSATPLDTGATNTVTSGGSLLANSTVAVDYGQVANTFFARFTPALVVCALAGAVLIASKGGVRMVHGWLRGAFH